ncbi:MAG: LysR family transcriptional regulator [Drouetiella hepatica Uher 2000/2452]|jgi:DNA-binding transcriptional LysR family regulator|uniref:LysR family transcriptional regulator n=1 Tax=Drouetiella hepatica Uher 2000/2452 TaxID=904376 RepID=A0A951QAM4_9CYAN|nr:LysR family transcriptional regulator [Drouetiella hepatica Uher 2000/2452]
MNLENIKLHQLRSLTAAAQCGNFSEAALLLNVSQSAVSHAIAALETELGVVLFARGRHGATLTPVGERIVTHAQDILRSIDNVGKEAVATRSLQGGQVRIAAFRSAATHLLPKVMVQFQKAFPAIAVILRDFQHCVQIEAALRSGQIDLGLTLLPTAPEFETWELLRDEYVVLLPPDWTIAHDPITWDHLATYPLILPTENDCCRAIINNYYARLRRSLSPTYEVREDSTILGMVEQGLGFTIMSRLAAEPISPRIQIRTLPDPLERVIGVAVLADAQHPPAVYAFLNQLQQMGRSDNVAQLPLRSVS